MLSRIILLTWRAEMGWYLYLLLLAFFLFAFATSILIESPTVFDVLDVPMAVTALVGVFGFVSRMQLLSPWFWRVFMLTLLAWHIIYHLVLAWQMDVALRPVAGSWEYLVVGLAFVVPMYVVLFLYGYRSKAVWAGQTEPRLPTLPGANNNAMRWFLLVQWALLIPFLLVLFQLDLSLIQTALYALVGGLLVLGPLEILIPHFPYQPCRVCRKQ